MPVDPTAPVSGTQNGETLQGTDGADTLFGLGGNDSLIGDQGNDSLVGGSGNDTLRGGHGDDTLEGGDGDDEIEGLYGDDVIDTGAGNDHVFGRDGNDLIYGREGDDHLIGSIGTDTVYGGDGNDILAGSQGNDEIHGGAGNDLAFIGTLEDSDRIFMDEGNDFVDGGFAGSSFYAEGGSGNDTLTAGVGDDTLLGGSGNDLINGGSGNDRLSGGGDHDTVSGGDGDDVFIIQDSPGSLFITDFGANGASDLIDLSALTGYDTAAAVSQQMTFGAFQTTLNLEASDGPLVITIHHATPLTAADLGLSGTLTGTNTGEGPATFGADPDGGTPSQPEDPGTDRFVLEGPDAGYFLVDPDDGTLTNIEWFTPQYNQVWDANADRTYEVSLVERDADGAEVDRSNLELIVTQSGASWHDADNGAMIGEETLTGSDGDDTIDGTDGSDTEGDGTVYTLAGEDAGVFVIDGGTGDVSYQNWFTPNYDEVWDMDRDHIYEVSVIGSDSDGVEISRQDFELVVSETDAVWQEATIDPDTDDGGETDNTSPDETTYAGDNVDGVTYALAGDDAAIFVIDPNTGDVSYQNWFTPNYDEVWDLDRDHIYEITVVGTNATGAEVSRQGIELVVSETDARWQEASEAEEPETPAEPTDPTDGNDSFAGPDEAGVTYALAGEDAGVFVIDPDSGDVSYQNWFTPNYDEVWDLDRDHIYEVSVIGTNAAGEEVSQQDIELIVTQTDVVWQEVGTPPVDPETPIEPTDPIEAAAFLNGDVDADLLNTFDAAADLYIDAQGNSNAPIFDGSIDWHSSVHGHLANVAAYEANGDQAGMQAFADARFTPQDVQGEIDLNFDDPYGWAWLLKLDTQLQENGIDNLAPAGEHFAGELESDLVQQLANGSTDQGEGSYNDANWKIANLIQYAQGQSDSTAEARYLDLFDQIQADTNVGGDTPIAQGDFFSALSLSAYAHVIAGSTDTALYQNIHDQMLESVTDGSLDTLLDTEGARLDAGIGFSHSAGIAISSAYGYWAMFQETQNPAFYDAYSNVVEWTETYAPEMGASIGPGHWLPNFASFAADLPSQMPVEDLDGSLTAAIEDWLANGTGPSGPTVSEDADQVLTGTAGNDVLTGGQGNDLLDGARGKDTLDGGAGDDTLLAGFDDGTGDVFVGGAGTDTYDIASSEVGSFAFDVDLAAGSDQYGNSYSGIENVLGGAGNDTLTGDGENNLLDGGAGNDLLDGAGGKDTLDGGAGDDTLLAGFDDGTGDVFVGGAGNDTYDIASSEVGSFAFDVDLAAGSDQYGNSYSGIENVLGGAGNDTLTGDGENNLLDGGAGNDLLNAGAGADTLTGGAGDDVFAVTADAGALLITDFGQSADGDQIDVSALGSVFSNPAELMAALSFSGGETTFNVEFDGESKFVTIQSEEELEEGDFLF